ncbi:MAG: ABC transporter substrate-binding protein, partial [Bacteroidetes bacterium]
MSSQYFMQLTLCFGIVACLVSCGRRVDDGSMTYWSASNPEEMSFAQGYVEAWNTSHPDNPIQFQPVPEGQSSEEIILSAVVAKTTPDIYANMWQGDVEDYARAGVIVPLDTLDGFMEFMQARCDTRVLEEITSADGHIYQIPWKVNPIMMMYNPDIFLSVGVDTIPRTYSDFLDVAKKVTKDRDGNGYIDRWMGTTEVSAIWWQRLFNFVPLYYAASGGAPLVKNDKAAFDNEHGIAVFAFLQEIYKNGYFPREQMKGQSDPFIAKNIAVKFTGPWSIENINMFKPDDLRFGFSQIPVPDDMTEPVYTYCDPKNIVIFSTCNDPEGAWRFLQTMLTAEADLEFMKLSSQIPRRKDLLTDSRFTSYLDQNQELKPFAIQSQYLKGMDSSTNLKEVLDLISNEYEACVVYAK